MRQSAVSLLTYGLKSGICLLIPLPVPKAWEAELRRNSANRWPLFSNGDGQGGSPISHLLLSISSASCHVDKTQEIKTVKAFFRSRLQVLFCPASREKEQEFKC